ncbi:MAG TPA: serine/threonine-protein kinase [Gemmatimonadales bacterium]|jgi:serine/threonine-protein kinase|nr:serine/threonine-protein kinase [Gemmatimonadales bacterium]
MRSNPSSSFLALQGTLAGRYALERELGRGGMGVVYLARDLSLDRPVAIKLLPPALAARPAFRARFLREARTAARLSHPNIVPIHAVEEHGEFVLFVMGYVEGETLAQRIARQGSLSPEEATRILQEVTWALAYAHQHGVIHRDVKPDNILLERGSGRALVSDFGIAQVADPAAGAETKELVGTARYMSPEQLAGAPLDGRSDLYSLGVTALVALQPRLPARLAPIVERCLAPDPADRFPAAEALAEALGAVYGHRAVIPSAVERFVDLYKTLATEIATYAAVIILMGVQLLIARNTPVAGALFAVLLVWAFFGALGLGFARFFELVKAARRLLAEGYSMADVRSALRGPAETPGSRTTPWFATAGWVLAAVLWVLGYRWQMGVSLGAVLDGLILALFTLVPVIAIRAAFARMLRPGKSGWWSRLWWKVMEWKVFKVAGLGQAVTAVPASEPTEVALGAGARELFERLPAELRKRFAEVPDVLKRLEAQAGRLRDGDSPGTDQRLVSTLAALEQVRLDLLRLRAGTGSEGELTGDLDAARRITERIEALVAARHQLEP